MAARFFSVDEANALVPTLEQILTEVQAARRRLIEARPEIQPVLEKAQWNSGNLAASLVVEDFYRIERGVDRLRGLGVLVKDLNSGLVDFLSEREGREVLLCWRLGEERVRFWHELHTGFAGRQPL